MKKRRGESPETICQNFELLRLEEVYGAITYYLASQAEWMPIRFAKTRSGPTDGAKRNRPIFAKGSRAPRKNYRRLAVMKARFLAEADLNKAIVNRLRWPAGVVTEVSLRSPHQEIYFCFALRFRIKQCSLRKFGD